MKKKEKQSGKKKAVPGNRTAVSGRKKAVPGNSVVLGEEKAATGAETADSGEQKAAGVETAVSGTGVKPAGEGKDNTHSRDINSKTVFRDRVLCAQFLRDNCEIAALKQVRPEDIEDISERYIPYLGKEFDSDSVKKIRILDIGNGDGTGEKDDGKPHFLVSLIEHKSLVDHDVSMQLLRYMMCIWTEYRREKETEREGSTSRKDFRYPLIIPIVYYEGKAKWTADRQLSGRIENGVEYRDWIPDFRYEVVRIHDYSNEELLKRGNEMSLIMMFNKIQDASDLEEFIHIPPEELDRIVRDSPGHVLDVLEKVMESLCFKIDASEEERTQCVRRVRAREMGYLFENMEHMSLQEERRKTEEQRRKTEEQRRKTEEQRRIAEEERRRAEEERRRAEGERRRADEECRRAEEAEEKLRSAEETIRQLMTKTQQ